MKIRIRHTGKDWLMVFLFYMLLLHNALADWIPLFKYIDEAFSLLGIFAMIYHGSRTGKVVMKKTSARILLLLTIFVMTGILGNIIYQYQKLAYVLIDLWVNVKFFLSVISGYVLFRFCKPDRKDNVIVGHARIAAAVFFILLIVDLVFQPFSSPEYRYGLRVVQLFYGHPTYLAGATVFLLTIFLAFYEKKNILYMAMSLTVQFFTLRGKAIAGCAVYILLFYFLVIYRKKLKLWHIILVGLAAVGIAWEQIYGYYIALAGESARSVLTQTSFQIMKDYFPIGTGFGTYASNSAAVSYSPVYLKYGLSGVYGLSMEDPSFASDTFWPIIIGQTGAIGTLCYVSALALLFLRILRFRKISITAYTAGIFAFAYLMISATSEPAFHNPIACPLAMMLGYIFTLEKKSVKEDRKT